jgi:hypothetical protein
MDRGQFENDSLEIKNILNKFNHIGFLDYKEVKKALLINETITNKLDYLKKIKENYFDKYLTVFLSLNEKKQRFQSDILKSIFGNYELWSSLQIQEPIYDEFFRDLENQDTEYQYWFMRFSAEEKFKAKLNSEDYKDMQASKNSNLLIIAELKEITDVEDKAYQIRAEMGATAFNEYGKGFGYLLDFEKIVNGEVDAWTYSSEHIKYLEVLRIIGEVHYKKHFVPEGNIGDLQAENYFKYILYKEHLEELLKNDSNNKKQQDREYFKSTISKEQLFEEQNNLVTEVSIEEVYNHFEVLIKKTNKNDEFYLTKKQLITFIKSTFVDQEPIKQFFNCKGFVKKEIRTIFFNFYFHNKNKEKNEKAVKRKYFKIMNAAFYGFNENDYTDFAK